jgi:hypothetical protein
MESCSATPCGDSLTKRQVSKPLWWRVSFGLIRAKDRQTTIVAAGFVPYARGTLCIIISFTGLKALGRKSNEVLVLQLVTGSYRELRSPAQTTIAPLQMTLAICVIYSRATRKKNPSGSVRRDLSVTTTVTTMLDLASYRRTVFPRKFQYYCCFKSSVQSRLAKFLSRGRAA